MPEVISCVLSVVPDQKIREGLRCLAHVPIQYSRCLLFNFTWRTRDKYDLSKTTKCAHIKKAGEGQILMTYPIKLLVLGYKKLKMLCWN